MDAEKLNPLIDPQPDDTLFVARYVEGLFTPFRFTLGSLLGQIQVTPPEFSTESSLSVGSNTTTQITTDFTVVKSVGTDSYIALPNVITARRVDICNRSGEELSIITLNGVTIEGQTSVTIPVGTTVTFFYVGGDQWYTK